MIPGLLTRPKQIPLFRSTDRFSQVVDGRAADGHRGEALLDPGLDLAGGPPAAPEAAAPTGDVVVEVAVGDVLLELLQRRRGIAAAEAAEREHGPSARQRQPGRLHRAALRR